MKWPDLLPNSFVESLSHDPVVALDEIFQRITSILGQMPVDDTSLDSQIIEAQAFAECLMNDLDADIEPAGGYNIPLHGISNAHEAVNWFFAFKDNLNIKANQIRNSDYVNQGISKAESFLARRSASVTVYTFSDSEYSRIQELINELRDEVTSNTHISVDHRRRLLKRLERLQHELHKTMSDTDRVWGLVAEAGIVLGKFGENSKPIVDRIKELADIVWKVVSVKEKLESGMPLKLPGAD